MAKIENYKYTVEEAFRNCFYVIPDYQREYVWTNKEVQQLLDDISEQIDGGAGREYFIGMVLVSLTDQNNHFEVIDGQQRLTTFFLLLCALRQLFKGEPQYQTISGLISTSYTSSDGFDKPSLKLDPRYENASEAMAKIVELNADPETTRSGIEASGIRSFGSLENLVNAYDTIFQYLKNNYENKADLRKYWGYLANKVVFFQISTDVSSALKIFETINERGVGLNAMDLLKNLLFTRVQKEEFTRLKDEWKKITAPLEKENEKPLRFLRYFVMANYQINNLRKDSVVREDEIYDWLIDETNAARCNYKTEPFGFVRKIVRTVAHYLAFAEGRGNDGKANTAMENLRLLTGSAFSLHYVPLLAASNLPKQQFDYFVRQLESFLFHYIFTKSPTKELERNFSLWADELREIAAEADQKNQKEKLNRFVSEHFEKGMQVKKDELRDALKRYSLNLMQKYRTRYFLAKLTQHVDLAYKGLKEPGSLDEYIKLEIEHILPNNPKLELRAEFEAKSPDANYEVCKNRIGNLTLLEKPINIVASNDFFAAKCVEYAKCKYYLTSSLVGLTEVGKNSSITRMNEKLAWFKAWNASDIEKRQGILIGLAEEVWKIDYIDIQ